MAAADEQVRFITILAYVDCAPSDCICAGEAASSASKAGSRLQLEGQVAASNVMINTTCPCKSSGIRRMNLMGVASGGNIT